MDLPRSIRQQYAILMSVCNGNIYRNLATAGVAHETPARIAYLLSVPNDWCKRHTHICAKHKALDCVRWCSAATRTHALGPRVVSRRERIHKISSTNETIRCINHKSLHIISIDVFAAPECSATAQTTHVARSLYAGCEINAHVHDAAALSKDSSRLRLLAVGKIIRT